jgi:hypothetical protein
VNVRLLAAAGLRVLLDLHDRRARAGMRVVLAAPSPSVQRVLVVTKLAHTLSMTATLDDAVALITAAPSIKAWATASGSNRRSRRYTKVSKTADSGDASNRYAMNFASKVSGMKACCKDQTNPTTTIAALVLRKRTWNRESR